MYIYIYIYIYTHIIMVHMLPGSLCSVKIVQKSPVMRGFAGGGKQPQSGAFRRCRPAACILGLARADMRLSLMCGFPC